MNKIKETFGCQGNVKVTCNENEIQTSNSSANPPAQVCIINKKSMCTINETWGINQVVEGVYEI